jgi:Ca2+-binding RTX toxin-like protein
MAKVVGTNETDFIWVTRLFDRDGPTDGDDTIYGLGGDDWIEGGDGNDILEGGEGADRLFGGDDIDTAIYSDSPDGVYVNLQTGEGQGGTAWGDHLYSIENLTGSLFGDDYLIGDSNDNVLSGLGGDDNLEGGAGADTLDGDWGVDTATYAHSPAGVMVSLLWDSASGGDADGDELNSIENLYGSKYGDGLFGDNGANGLDGYAGNDTLLGFDGNDNLNGGSGNDSLNGGAGQDILRGGQGGDTLFGGPDADTFVWSMGYDYYGVIDYETAGLTASGTFDFPNMDVILDFNPAQDKIDVHYIDANVPMPGIQAFDFIGEYYAHGGFTAPGQAAYTSDGIDTYLIFNTDETLTINTVGDFEFAIKVSGVHTPDASWFVNL